MSFTQPSNVLTTSTTSTTSTTAPSSTIDQDLYSRQLYIFDMTSMSSIQATNIVLIGLENTALEILKNIVLAGIISIELYDPRLITEDDLSFGFYILESDIGKRRDCVYKRIIQENILALIKVKVYSDLIIYNIETIKHVLTNQQICLVSEGTIQFLEDINQICRIKNIKFMAVKTRGFFSFVFIDLIEFVTKDVTGEPQLMGYGVWNEDILDVTERKDFVKGMCLKLKDEVEMHSVIEVEIVEVINSCQVKINRKQKNERAFSFEEIKQPKKYVFDTLTTVLKSEKQSKKILCEPWEMEVSSSCLKMFRSECIFKFKHSRLPTCLDIEEFTNILKDNFFVEIKEDRVNWFLKGSNTVFYPLLSVIGGFVGQEILKAASNKYSLLNQMWLYECFSGGFEKIFYLQDMVGYSQAGSSIDLNNSGSSINNVNKTHQPNGLDNKPPCVINGTQSGVTYNKDEYVKNKRTKLLANLIGNENVKTISLLTKPFLIGVGAIGCELLKNFAMLNISNIQITDSDSVEFSNLSRQFLFNKADIGKMKSEAVKRALNIINPNLKIISHTNLIQDKKFESPSLMEKIGLFANALDNLEARLHADGLSMKYGKSMFDAGTLGTKGSTFCSLKGISENWGAQQDPKESSIPVCTLRSFPSNATHAIEFGLDEFKIFNEHLDFTKKMVEKIIKHETFEVSEILNVLKFPISRNQVIFSSLRWFRTLFYSNIETLKATYPRDHMTSDGAPFWNSLKRYPLSIEFDAFNDIHKMCVLSMCNVFIQCITGTEDGPSIMSMSELEKILRTLNLSDLFKMADDFILFEKTENEKFSLNDYEGFAFLKELCDFLQIKNLKKHLLQYPQVKPINLEKDNDNNFHINLIHHIALLRCINYRIKEPSDFLFTKGIAGKIIPAISTTTGMVSGLLTIEIIKYVLYFELSQRKGVPLEDLFETLTSCDDIKDFFNNSFVDLGQPWIGSSNPLQPATYETIEGKSTVWSTITFPMNREETLQDFIDKFEKKYMTIGYILLNGMMIYSTTISSEERKSLLNKPLHKICRGELIGFFEVVLDEMVEVPNVKLVLE
ncbi:Ubiquitin-activating enzyme E1 1 [Cucumispora dikerogammari]|nr:Ubiquitin-activating enzyme E1 1 [Cucumispora dikerogammari]